MNTTTGNSRGQGEILHAPHRAAALLSQLSCAAALRQPKNVESARPLTLPLLRLRGGNMFLETTKTMIYQRARRDDHRSLVCGGRGLMGIWLLTQPLKHLGYMDRPIGTATAQLFFAAHFYLRLLWLLVAQQDFFAVPKKTKGKVRKRMISSVILLGSFLAARWVGWRHEDAPMLRRALPSGLALGVVIARTSTAIFDYGASGLSEALRVLNARREVFQPDYTTSSSTWKNFRQTLLQSPRPRRASGLALEEQQALEEAADVARKAMSQALASTSKKQEAVRRAASTSSAVQCVRTAIAITTTVIGLRCACDGSYPLAHHFLPAEVPATPASMALYAPALVGAFEVSQAVREFSFINEYHLSNAKLYLLTKALRWFSWTLGAVRSLGSAIGRLALKAERAIFGEEFVLLHAYEKVRSSSGAARAGAALKSVRSASFVAWLGKSLVRVLKWVQGYRKLVKWLQKQVKALLRGTQHDLWPWALALAGLQLQLGNIRLKGVPTYTLKLTAYPVVAVSKLMGLMLLVGWRRLRRLTGAVRAAATLLARGLRRMARAKARTSTGAATSRLVASVVAADGGTSLAALADASSELASDAMAASFDVFAYVLDSSASAFTSALDGIESVVVSAAQKDAAAEAKLGDVF